MYAFLRLKGIRRAAPQAVRKENEGGRRRKKEDGRRKKEGGKKEEGRQVNVDTCSAFWSSAAAQYRKNNAGVGTAL